jgi:putative polyhydroxyalkanoate system protein
MASISIRRSHGLTRSQALAAARRIAAQLAADHGISTVWSGSTATINGPGMAGEFRIKPRQIELDLDLGLMLMMFKEKLSAGIETRLDEVLTVGSKKKITRPRAGRKGDR